MSSAIQNKYLTTNGWRFKLYITFRQKSLKHYTHSRCMIWNNGNVGNHEIQFSSTMWLHRCKFAIRLMSMIILVDTGVVVTGEGKRSFCVLQIMIWMQFLEWIFSVYLANWRVNFALLVLIFVLVSLGFSRMFNTCKTWFWVLKIHRPYALTIICLVSYTVCSRHS